MERNYTESFKRLQKKRAPEGPCFKSRISLELGVDGNFESLLTAVAKYHVVLADR
jgi:hypothetical protein